MGHLGAAASEDAGMGIALRRVHLAEQAADHPAAAGGQKHVALLGVHYPVRQDDVLVVPGELARQPGGDGLRQVVGVAARAGRRYLLEEVLDADRAQHLGKLPADRKAVVLHHLLRDHHGLRSRRQALDALGRCHGFVDRPDCARVRAEGRRRRAGMHDLAGEGAEFLRLRDDGGACIMRNALAEAAGEALGEPDAASAEPITDDLGRVRPCDGLDRPVQEIRRQGVLYRRKLKNADGFQRPEVEAEFAMGRQPRRLARQVDDAGLRVRRRHRGVEFYPGTQRAARRHLDIDSHGRGRRHCGVPVWRHPLDLHLRQVQLGRLGIDDRVVGLEAAHPQVAVRQDEEGAATRNRWSAPAARSGRSADRR